MTTTVDVERIDIKEGPNRSTLLLSSRSTQHFKERYPGIEHQTWFSDVRYLNRRGRDMRHFLSDARTFRGELVEIAYLGDNPDETDEFLLKVSSVFGTFEGHYNTHLRKGVLRKVK
jgi:hypothetical protein